MKSWKKPTDETVDRALKLIEKETDRQHFFSHLKNPWWIQPLSERDRFKYPPAIRHLPDGYVQYPFWPELEYLKNVSLEAPKEVIQEVIQIVLGLPAVDNPRIYNDILDIALSLDGEQSARLKPKMLEYARLEHQFLAHRYYELVVHWVVENQIQAALELVEILVQFYPDPKAEEKAKERRENSYSFIMLEPTPKLGEWDYQELLDKGVRSLADKEPVEVARMLIDTTASMIHFKKSQDELESGTSQDESEVWYPKLNEQSEEHQDPKKDLVHTLVYACEKVYENSPESIVAIDNTLRHQRWNVFKRLRQHLYALHPSELTKPWIREFILAHGDYEKYKHGYEFQQMVSVSCEYFGGELLAEEERTQIFDTILRGPSEPSEENYRKFLESIGEEFTESYFDGQKRNFHRLQLRPFTALLFGKYATYFEELKNDEEKEITDDAYLLFQTSEVRDVTFRSPRSPDELSKFSDEELLDYINEWQDEHIGPDNWTRITISALAEAFQDVFTESIIPDDDRLEFWTEKNRERIERPIYVKSAIRAMQEQVEGGNFGQLDRWFDFCKWVISHFDEDREENANHNDILQENPSWRSSRRSVVNFVEVCLKKEVDVPISARERLAELLETLCIQFDWALDRDRPVLLNRNDPLTEAINTTRGLALDNLDNFVGWVHRHDDKAEVHEVIFILEKRFRPETEYPLTIPEYAILGMNYWQICQLNQEWAAEHKSDFFPQGNMPAWQAAFGNFLNYNRPYKPAFDIVRDEFEFSLEHLDSLKQQNSSSRKVIDTLGKHVFLYYLWDVYPLTDDSSLLARFYQKANDERKHWATLFDNIGRLLQNTSKPQFNKDLKDRTIAFFEWRLEVGEPMELRKFAFWLEAECLEAEWRLEAYFKILDVPGILDVDQSEHRMSLWSSLRSLHTMLPEHTAQVVECFDKLIRSIPEDRSIYVSTDEARAILKAGFDHDDESVRKTAEDARENLLRRGYLSFLDLDD